jgi:hypothetical protein
MTFQASDFVRSQDVLFQCTWTKSESETPTIFIWVGTDEALSRAVPFLNRLVAKEPVLRKQAAQSVYPTDSYWLADELEIGSADALDAVLNLSIIDVRESGDDTYQTKLVYTGPDDFQTITAKHVLLVDVAEDGEVDASFDSYDED